MLNYDESLLIFNNVTSTLGFVRSIEAKGEAAWPSGSFAADRGPGAVLIAIWSD